MFLSLGMCLLSIWQKFPKLGKLNEERRESKGTHGSLWLKPYELVCNALMLLHRKPGALTLKPERSNNSLKIFLRILSELGLYCLSTDSRELFVVLEKEVLQTYFDKCVYVLSNFRTK
jgi:hypothetical protein